MKRFLAGLVLGLVALGARAELTPAALDQDAATIEPRLLDWRRDLHQHPELGNREFRSSKIVAEHLEALGLEVHAGIAHTGVAAVSCAADFRGRPLRCAPTWTPCRSPSRSTCRSGRR